MSKMTRYSNKTNPCI